MPPQNQYPPQNNSLPPVRPPASGGMYPGQVPNPDNQPVPNPDKKKKLLALIPLILAGILLIGGISFVLISKSDSEQTDVPRSSVADFSAYNAAYDAWRQKGVTDFEPDEKTKTLESLDVVASDFSFKQGVEGDSIDQLIALGVAKAHAENRLSTQIAKLRLYVLFQDKLASVPAGITDENADLPDADEARAIYQKNQSTELTEAVKAAITERGLETRAIEALQLGTTPLDPYELFALKFNTKSDGEKTFREEMGYTGWIPGLWTQTYHDARFIAFTKQYAKEFVSAKNPATDALFLHEFSHTQSPLARGNAGLLLEERRAEEVSGNKGAYYDIKQFFIYVNMLTNYDMLASIQDGPVEVERIYGELYSTLGVELADAIIASFPVQYLDSTTPVKDIATVQNMDTAIKLAKQFGEADDPDTQLQRTKERAKRLVEIFGSESAAIADLQTNVAQNYMLPTVADIMIAAIKNN